MFPIAYFIIGGMLYSKKEEIRINRWWLLSTLLGTMLVLTAYGYLCTRALGTEEWYNVAGNSYSSVLVVISTICMFLLFKDVQIKNKLVARYLSVLGRNILGIYFIHIPIGYSLNMLLRKNFRITYWGFPYAIIFCIIVLNISLLPTVIFKKLRKMIKDYLYKVLANREKKI